MGQQLFFFTRTIKIAKCCTYNHQTMKTSLLIGQKALNISIIDIIGCPSGLNEFYIFLVGKVTPDAKH